MRYKPNIKDLPLQYDHILTVAAELEIDGKWDFAARLYRHAAMLHGNTKDMATREANALFHFGDYESAIKILKSLTNPTVSVYLIKGRCLRALGRPKEAIVAYENARSVLEGKRY